MKLIVKNADREKFRPLIAAERSKLIKEQGLQEQGKYYTLRFVTFQIGRSVGKDIWAAYENSTTLPPNISGESLRNLGVRFVRDQLLIIPLWEPHEEDSEEDWRYHEGQWVKS
jgi:hypothetical protein